MSLARSFTKRFARGDKHDKQAPSTAQISSPVSLLATSNSQLHEVPDLADAQRRHAMRPFHPPEITSDRFGGFSSPVSGASTPSTSQTPQLESPGQDAPGLTDSSSIEESSPIQPSDNYFSHQPLRTKTVRQVSSTSSLSRESGNDCPAIPHRAPSHSKREHFRLHRSRSVQRQSMESSAPSLSASRASHPSSAGPGTPRESESNERVSEPEWRSSFDIIGRSGSLMDKQRKTPVSQSPRSRSIERSHTVAGTRGVTPKHDNPFSQELEQLEEVAEEFTGVADFLDRSNDENALVSQGLAKFTADEYINEIGALQGIFLANDTRTALVNVEGDMHGWI